MTKGEAVSDHVTKGYRDRLDEGRRAMAHLIHVWHERNGWSHKVLPALADALDLGRVHNSQISNLRNGKLASPGPEVFLALGQANAILDAGLDPIQEHLAEVHPDLLKVLKVSAVPVISANGKPLGAGQLLEIFVGLAPLPPGFDWRIDPEEAAPLSAALADCLCHKYPHKLESYCRCRVRKQYLHCLLCRLSHYKCGFHQTDDQFHGRRNRHRTDRQLDYSCQ